MSGAECIGFLYSNEIYPNNIDFLTECLENPRNAVQGVTEEYAKKEIEIQKRFADGKEHSRLVGHEIEVYLIEDPSWKKTKNYAVPEGTLKSIFKMDFGEEIGKICKQESSNGEVIEEGASYDLGDGTKIIGKRVKESQYKGPADHRIIPNNHLNISFDSSGFVKHGGFSYNVGINRQSIKLEQLKEFHITTYVLIDGEEIRKQKEIIKPAFKIKNKSWTPFDETTGEYYLVEEHIILDKIHHIITKKVN